MAVRKAISMKLDADLLARADAFARRSGLSRTALVESALEVALREPAVERVEVAKDPPRPAPVHPPRAWSVREDAGAAYRAMMSERQRRLNEAGRDPQG